MVIKGSFFNPQVFEYFQKEHESLPITIFWDTLPKNREELNLNPYNIFLAHEPNDFFGIQSWLIANNHLFDAVLSWDKTTLSKCLNGIPFYCGWIFDWEHFTPTEKEFNVSFLSGVKTITYGHKLRQDIYKIKDKINIPNKWYHTLEDFDHTTNVRPGYKEYSKDTSHIPKNINPEVYGKQSLFDSMFHVAVENINQENWYTEKIFQAFLNKSIPIYWGCPNLEEIGYDTRGVIYFNSIEELINIVNNLTEEDYIKRLPFIEYNYEIAKQDTIKNKFNYIINQIKSLNKL